MRRALARDRLALHQQLVHRLDLARREADEALVGEVGHQPPGLTQLLGVVAPGDLELAREGQLVEVNAQLGEHVGGDDVEPRMFGEGAVDREADVDMVEVSVLAVGAVGEDQLGGLGEAGAQGRDEGVEVEAAGGIVGQAETGKGADPELGADLLTGRNARCAVALEIPVGDAHHLARILGPREQQTAEIYDLIVGVSSDDEQAGSLDHGGSLPDSSTSDQIDAAALRASLRELARRGGETERPRLIVELGHDRVLIKAIDRDQLQDRAFLVSRPLDGLRLRLRTQIFAHAGQLYELVRLDPRLRPAAASELDALFVLYEQADRVCMLAPFVDLDALLRGPHINKDIDRGDGHPAGPGASLDGVLAELAPTLAPLRPATDAGLRRGLVHGDLHRHNLMVPRAGEGSAVLIDLDPLLHSYAALNLAHLCIDEYIVGAGRHAQLPGFRARVLARLAPADAAAFDYLVLVELFRMLVKRAFHRQHYSEDWEEELLFLFEGYGVDTYLARVRGASSA